MMVEKLSLLPLLVFWDNSIIICVEVEQ